MRGKLFINIITSGLVIITAGFWDFSSADQPAKPNIVFILADDLGWSELGCYGNTYNETPNLDKLARQGMKFTQAYAAAPVCSPYRAAFLTGQYPARVGITDYMRWTSDPLPRDHITLAEMFQQAGYKTGLVGKWHLTGYKDKGASDEIHPTEHGFDEEILWGRKKGEEFKGWYNDKNEYLTDRLGKEAVQFIDRHKNEPFFLFLSHYAPHTYLMGKGHLVNKYMLKKKTGRYQWENYANNTMRVWKERYVSTQMAAMLETLDESVGMVLEKLDQLGLAKNTIVIFTSDNGGEEFVTSNYPLRAGKSTLYEGGIREPLIVRWPGVVPENVVSNVPTSNYDFYPTLLEVAGITPDPRQKLDGISILATFKNPSQGIARNTFYWHYPLEKKHFLGGRSSGAIRHSDWKLIEYFDTGKIELYNLAEDIGEKNNLAEQNPDKKNEIYSMLVDWRNKNGFTIDSNCTNYDPNIRDSSWKPPISDQK